MNMQADEGASQMAIAGCDAAVLCESSSAGPGHSTEQGTNTKGILPDDGITTASGQVAVVAAGVGSAPQQPIANGIVPQAGQQADVAASNTSDSSIKSSVQPECSSAAVASAATPAAAGGVTAQHWRHNCC